MVSICHEKCEQFETNVEEDVYALRMCLAQSIIISNIYTYNGDVQCEHYIRGVCDDDNRSEERLGMTQAELGLMKKDPVNVERWCKSPKMKQVLVEQCKLWCPKQPQVNGVSDFPPDAGPGKPGLNHMEFTKCVVQLEDSLIASGEWETLVKEGTKNGPYEAASADSASLGPMSDAEAQQIKDSVETDDFAEASAESAPVEEADEVDQAAEADEVDPAAEADEDDGEPKTEGEDDEGGDDQENGDGQGVGFVETGSDRPDPPAAPEPAAPQLLARAVSPSGAWVKTSS
jgi:hypothetical protein